MEERLSKLDSMARKVVSGNPEELRHVQDKQAEITELWKKLKIKAANRKAQLENAFFLQTFLAESRDLVCALKWDMSMCKSVHKTPQPTRYM